jgi:hypothetical protein
MAYSTGTYTGQDNALALFYAWALTNSWDQEYTAADGDGTRAHISKTIGSSDFFFNFRSTDGTDFMADTGGNGVGIFMNGSGEFTGSGTVWDRQLGFTTDVYAGSQSAVGNVTKLIASGTYHFFATATNLSAVFESDSDQSDWRMFTVGSMGGYSAYFGSGANTDNVTATYDARSSYCARTATGVSEAQTNSSSLFVPTEGWYGMRNDSAGNDLRCVREMVNSIILPLGDTLGSVASPIVAFTPDSFRGNAQLAPSSITITEGTADEYWPVSDIEGVKFINMTNYTNGQEIVYDGDTYMLFRIYNPSTTGVAFLK